MVAKKLLLLEVTLLALVLALGLVLRVQDIALFRMSPDEGNYLWSARVQQLEQSPDLGTALSEDADWLLPRYYPHSYLHQLAIRWVWRLGGGAVFSVRIDSAVLGLLTALAVFLFASRAFPDRRPIGFIAGAIVAVQCLHVWYSRTGWGQTGCTFFFAVYLALGYFLLRKERSLARDALIASGMGLASLLAYGWHEMIVVHVGGMGILVLLQHVWGGAGFAGWGLASLPVTLLRSRKAWMALLSALPVVALFATLFYDPFARRHWIDFENAGRDLSYGENLGAILRFLFLLTHIQRQISWPILALAVVGIVSLRRRDRFAFRFFATTLLTSTVTFVLFYKDAYLVRIYLPTAVVLAILAAEGTMSVAGLLGERLRETAGLVAGGALALWMSLVTWQTIRGWDGDPFFERYFHYIEGYELLDSRDTHARSFAILRAEVAPGEFVGVQGQSLDGKNVFGEFSVLFRLLDAGFVARPFAFNRPPDEFPRFVMGVTREMDQAKRTVATGGRYRLIEKDTFGRVGLYRLEDD